MTGRIRTRGLSVSQKPGLEGHQFMTNLPDSPDLRAIASEAQVEILVAETVQEAAARPDDAGRTFDAAEIGYYEAELRSLRDAATTLNEAEQVPE